jgi:hypothetical protein
MSYNLSCDSRSPKHVLVLKVAYNENLGLHFHSLCLICFVADIYDFCCNRLHFHLWAFQSTLLHEGKVNRSEFFAETLIQK